MNYVFKYIVLICLIIFPFLTLAAAKEKDARYDTDRDGKIDRIAIVDEKGEMVRLKIDTDKDGVMDSYQYYNQGEVVNLKIVKSSRVKALDEAALEAVRSAAPFPVPPAHLFEGEVKVQINISFPSIRQLYDPQNPNEDLKPEEAMNYELGVEHQCRKSATGLSVTGFYSDVENYEESFGFPREGRMFYGGITGRL